jgi:hypothetical protein
VPTTPTPVYTTQSSVYAAPENTAAVPASEKKHTLRNVLITAATLIVIAVGILMARPDLQPDFMRRPVELNEYGQIIFTQKKNNDELVMGNLALTLRDVKAAQKFIREKFPAFDFEEEGYVTDDYRNELLIKEFNTNPKVLSIYLGGITGMAGKSQVYAGLLLLDNELFSYWFSIDQEFSDTSGFEYFSGYYPRTSQYDGQITSIRLGKFLYSDTNEPYWEIVWNDDIPKRERLALLKSFLNSLRYTKVFRNFAFDFLKDVFTGIDDYQTIEDIVDWWGNRPPLLYTEEIYVESWGRLHYVLSNYASEIEKAIYELEGKNVDLDSLNWFVNNALSQNVKTVMNRLDVNYSYPVKTNRILNKRVGNTWYSAYF